jgi:hypothetical protein
MPVAPPLLAHGRFLGTAQRHALDVAGIADVAADAFADVVGRPSAILFGRKGSAIEGRAAPIRSTMPRFTWDSMVSGDVKRPTLTTGFCTMPRTWAIIGSSDAS